MLEEVEGGRRVLLEWPIAHLHATIGVVVLDSEQQQQEKMIDCAAMLVPSGREADWVFSSEGGQWQLLASSGAARLILLMRQAAVSGEDCSYSRNGLELEGSQLLDDDDEKLKEELSPLVVALAPKACFRSGPPVVPFLSYDDNVAWRRVVTRASSPLTGLMLVEDVRLASVAGGEATLRRRLRFKQMPNLIQTEVPLLIKFEAGDEEALCAAELDDAVDHGVLVHVYLAPLVAGLWLVSPALEACIASGELARVLCVGIGGGALPMFLNSHFDEFHVEAVDLDEVVVNLAMRHFGLVQCKNLRIRVEDGMVAVARLAEQERIKEEEVEIPSHAVQGRRLNDPRLHAIIVDVNAGDARAGLTSPPQAFLEQEFLVAARSALHQGGMLAMNVMPNGESMYKAVIDALIDVFEHVYEIQVADGENYAVFALPWCGMEVGADNSVASKVKSLISPELVKQIHRVSNPPPG